MSRFSPHWLRHAHSSHAIDRGATLPDVQNTLGQDNIATTSGYLHARPDSSSGLKLDPGVFRLGCASQQNTAADGTFRVFPDGN
jgi:integrase